MHLKNWTTPGCWVARQHREQQTAYQTGAALLSHCRTAHGGTVDSGCAACSELQRKTNPAALESFPQIFN